jgi:hypothetical protein
MTSKGAAMRSNDWRGDVNAHVDADSISGKIAIGNNIVLGDLIGDAALSTVTDAERAQLRTAFSRLRTEVEAQAPDERRDAAVERVEELERAVFADQPDLTTIQYVTGWFRSNLPKLAGVVTGVVIHPIVGKLVQSAGEMLAGEFEELLGGGGDSPG